MKIRLYEARMTKDDKVKLVTEKAVNYESGTLNEPGKVTDMLRELLKIEDMAEEYCYMIALNNAYKVIGVFFISKGTVNASLVTPRELYIRALLVGAVQIILCHNHPCGSAVPSEEDINVTNRIRKAGNLVGIKLTDHIIIGGGSYYSFREAEML